MDACDREIGSTPVEGALAARTRQRHHDVHSLAERGLNITSICRTLKLDPKTVHRYLRAASPEELIAPAAQRATSLERFKVYLAERFADDCTANGAASCSVRGFRRSRPPSFPSCAPSLAACARTGMRSRLGSPCPGGPAPWMAT